MIAYLTEKENKIIKMTADLWNEILELRSAHPSDNDEMIRSIHQIQDCIMARPIKRKINYNVFFVPKCEECQHNNDCKFQRNGTEHLCKYEG